MIYTFRNLKIVFIFFICLSIFYIKTEAQDSLDVSADISFDQQVLNSYTPAFYEGKPLASQEADIKIIANVEVSTPAGNFDGSKLYYYWTINDEMVHAYSKTGGNILYLTLDEFGRNDVIKLLVYTDNKQNTLLAEKTLTIVPRKTFPILYRKSDNPILTYANAINKKYEHYGVNLGDTFDIVVEPFYFSVKSPTDSRLSYLWSLNGIAGNRDKTNLFTYRAPTARYSTPSLNIKIDNKEKGLQGINIDVNFVFNR